MCIGRDAEVVENFGEAVARAEQEPRGTVGTNISSDLLYIYIYSYQMIYLSTVYLSRSTYTILLYTELPVVPVRGGAEVALGIYKTILIYRTCMRRAPAKPVRACILRKWCPVSHVTFEAPLRTSHFSLHSSHSTLRTSHSTLHTSQSTLHTALFTLHTSSHLSSSHLIPAHLFSSHLFSSHLFSYVSKLS